MFWHQLLWIVPVVIKMIRVEGFLCDDGCSILDGYVNDNYCDCPECEDEDDWTCSTCTCPTGCGEFYVCGDSGTTFGSTYDPSNRRFDTV